MVWSEYVRETQWEDSALSDGDEGPEVPVPMSCDDWTTWYSEHLMNMWMSLRAFHEDRYLKVPMGYTDFCEFAWKFSPDGDGVKTTYGYHGHSADLWDLWVVLVRYLRTSGVRNDIMCEASFKEFYEFYSSF